MDNLILNLQNYKDFKNFNNGVAMIESFKYENEYIKVLRIDASNKWTGIPHKSDMDKQWGIIIDIKKDFRFLQNYKKLTTVLDIDITPVHRGKNKGKYGIRIYHMAQNPNEEIVQQILNYIFE
ncbi:MAG: hypothetical protein J6Q51_04945 [Clostridia bacterium]|nr:hypothetical protein [Clostridia bacterium]